jgi:hypothetical protein
VPPALTKVIIGALPPGVITAPPGPGTVAIEFPEDSGKYIVGFNLFINWLIPTPPGTYPFTVQFFDGVNLVGEATYNLVVNECLPTPTDPTTLRYFDNANVVPAPQGVQVPFNDELSNVWLGYDAAQCRLCITNYNRTRIICCYQG